MTITTYNNFKKRINSTKQPTGGSTMTMTLKAPCSIERPVFTVKDWPSNANYFKWGDKYYYVTDVTHITNDIVQVTGDMDVLASYKTDILSTKAFVEYSSSDDDFTILDPRISTTTSVAINSSTNNFLDAHMLTAGRYILSLCSDAGVATRYVVDYQGLVDLGYWVSDLSDSTTSPARTRIERLFGNIYNAIINCVWTPFEWVSGGTWNSTIHLGKENTNVQAYKLAGNVMAQHYSTTLTIPYNNTLNARRNNEVVEIYLPGYGIATLKPSEINYATSVALDCYTDITGQTVYIVTAGNIKKYFSCNMGAEIPITQYVNSPRGLLLESVGGLWNNALSSGMANPLAAGVASALGELGSFVPDIFGRILNSEHSASCKGGQGGIALGYAVSSNVNDVIVKCTSYNYIMTPDNVDFIAKYGAPLSKMRTLSSLTGFCKCNGASVDIAGFETEKAKINAFVNGGFYIE